MHRQQWPEKIQAVEMEAPAAVLWPLREPIEGAVDLDGTKPFSSPTGLYDFRSFDRPLGAGRLMAEKDFVWKGSIIKSSSEQH